MLPFDDAQIHLVDEHALGKDPVLVVGERSLGYPLHALVLVILPGAIGVGEYERLGAPVIRKVVLGVLHERASDS